MTKLPDSISGKNIQAITALADRLQALPPIKSIVLGGSHAEGTANKASDIDLGLYYFDDRPIDINALAELVIDFDPTAKPTTLYEWGPYVNGGVWMTIDGQHVDLIYRSLNQLDNIIDDALAGQMAHHYWQQPAFGYHSQMMLADLTISQTLFDPDELLASQLARITPYPDAFKTAMIDSAMAAADLCLYQLEKAQSQQDQYALLGNRARFAYMLTLALFALNECWYRQDKGAWAKLAGFDLLPANAADRLHALTTHTADLTDVQSLFSELCDLCSYTSRLGALR